MVYSGIENTIYTCTKDQFIVSKSFDIKPMQQASEIQLDMALDYSKEISIWGQLKSTQGMPLAYKKVKLLRRYEEEGQEYFTVVADTITDTQGNYYLTTYGMESDDYTVVVQNPNGEQELPMQQEQFRPYAMQYEETEEEYNYSPSQTSYYISPTKEYLKNKKMISPYVKFYSS